MNGLCVYAGETLSIMVAIAERWQDGGAWGRWDFTHNRSSENHQCRILWILLSRVWHFQILQYPARAVTWHAVPSRLLFKGITRKPQICLLASFLNGLSMIAATTFQVNRPLKSNSLNQMTDTWNSIAGVSFQSGNIKHSCPDERLVIENT